MPVSVFALFRIGIGPSSSHTVGPMRAARRFVEELDASDRLRHVARVGIELFGSLALTGRAHATDLAVLLGLSGERPETVRVDRIERYLHLIRSSGRIALLGSQPIDFEESRDVIFRPDETLAQHPNGMRFTASFDCDRPSIRRTFLSIGGGFIVDAEEIGTVRAPQAWRHAFQSGQELLAIARAERKTIARIVAENELLHRTEGELRQGLDEIWTAMRECIERGLSRDGTLPGALKLPRRAKRLHERLLAGRGLRAPLSELDWVDAFAMAVSEENAGGGRVVTAPTNGAAGIIPAVMMYYARFCPGANEQGLRDFLLTAAAIGSLYKENASISGAEVGCQGETGVATSMAAAGLAAALGASNEQIENAAEVGMEHSLGLTCDPVAGLVQVPCIERNAMGAVKAINAAHLALAGDGGHFVPLDRVIAAMRQTGADMHSKYKETSLGGLAVAVNFVDC